MDVFGLTEKEVADRIRRGEVNKVEDETSRSYVDIIAKNVLTMFNLILFSLGAVLVILGEPVDALAATGIITMNILIATFQEIKAKRRLDKIALLLRPHAVVVRDGEEREIDLKEIVKDDVVVLMPGFQALVDGSVISSDHLEMDESLLTGETSTVGKSRGDKIHSGSFCVTGRGYYVAEALGKDTLASKMLVSARKYDTKLTPLQMETTAITKLLMTLALIYLFFAIIGVLLSSGSLLGNADLAKLAVVILEMVPIALPLLIVIAYMVAAIRMFDTGVLLQRSNSVESMSHVDTVCMDKTGTITTNKLLFSGWSLFTDEKRAGKLASVYLGATGGKNNTVNALIAEFGTAESELIDQIYFSSERKLSAVRVRFEEGEKTLFLGALSSLSDYFPDPSAAGDAVRGFTGKGFRSIVLAESEDMWHKEDNRYVLPSMVPVAVLALQDEIRHDCRKTIDVFMRNSMEIKVISGDDPNTINSLFSVAGIPGERNIISGDELGNLSGEAKTEAILKCNIFGRMTPDQKVDIIETLKDNGRYVAMVGDGVNDVKSLKSANVSVAMYSGAAAARGVADMVLMNDNFSALPRALEEGRKTISGMADILKLYLSRNFVLLLLIAFILLAFKTMPLHPTQVAFYAFTTVSLVAFFMVLWSKPRKVDDALLPGVLQYAVPMAVMISVFAFLIYISTYLLLSNGVFTVTLSDQSLTKLGWPAYDNVAQIADIKIRTAEIVAQNLMLAFVVCAGIVQTLFVAPVTKFFSVTGEVCRDRRPAILALLMLGLVSLAYNVPEATAIIKLMPLSNIMIAGLVGTVALWFFLTRFILRRGVLKALGDVTQRWYSFKFERTYGSR